MRNLKETVREVETQMILRALQEAGGVKARAARALGITERILDYKMRKYRIRKVFTAPPPRHVSAD